ncbi:MAG: hypothetical protein JOS17DRAFT_757108 [Linnemannia elongata]|nr:MAG: hypothetical protein JOS17DRAFT_757108 [Linnemannia elongata]
MCGGGRKSESTKRQQVQPNGGVCFCLFYSFFMCQAKIISLLYSDLVAVVLFMCAFVVDMQTCVCCCMSMDVCTVSNYFELVNGWEV